MEDNTTLLETEEQAVAETAELDAAFDDGWLDDDQGSFEDESAGEMSDEEAKAWDEADSDESTEEADQPADGDETVDGTDAGADSESTGEEGETQDQGETYTLRHLGEERNVNRDEVIRLAQQGMDYPRIREKWDAVKDDVQNLRMYEGFLKELADARGGTIEDLIDETRARTLIARAKQEGRELDPTRAAMEAVKVRQNFKPPDAKDQEAQAADEAADRSDRMIRKFVETYGDSIPAKDIPKEVWDDAVESGDLVGAWQKHLYRKTDAENKALREELQALKQQHKNKERSTGSSRTEGAAASRDPFDEGWDALL